MLGQPPQPILRTTPNGTPTKRFAWKCFEALAFSIGFPSWETDFYTPPVLGGAAFSDKTAPAVKKILCPKDPEFYTPLVLNCQKKGSNSQHWRLYKNQSPTSGNPPRIGTFTACNHTRNRAQSQSADRRAQIAERRSRSADRGAQIAERSIFTPQIRFASFSRNSAVNEP